MCGDFCYGPLFAVEADGSNLRRIGASVDVVPDEWNGHQLAFEDFPSDRRAVVVVDVATGERFEVGEGRSPAWKPGAGK